MILSCRQGWNRYGSNYSVPLGGLGCIDLYKENKNKKINIINKKKKDKKRKTTRKTGMENKQNPQT